MRNGLPAFSVIGLADAAVREARDRVRTAILNSGLEFPRRRVTANLAPAALPKAGPGLDLALACALLAATGQVRPQRLDHHALVGELALDGTVRGSGGTLAAARAARSLGLSAIVVAPERAREAALVDGLRVVAAASLRRAVAVLEGRSGDEWPASAPPAPAPAAGEDLADVRGQHHAVRALLIAAAGGHSILLAGAPGTGKTMLARRLPTILPPLAGEHAVEVRRIAELAGMTAEDQLTAGAIPTLPPPFRAPHHSVTAAGLIGGAHRGWVGEAVLAHNGVLFLDELTEFPRATLESLRQPLEDGRVTIARARGAVTLPARFMLIAAANPCPCGYAGERERCSCGEADLARHARKLSGPLLERIDILAVLRGESHIPDSPPLTSSAQALERILAAREHQAARLAGEASLLNAHAGPSALRRGAQLTPEAEAMLVRAGAHGLLSARGQVRVLRTARTIADLEDSAAVLGRHIGAALALRPQTIAFRAAA